MFAWTRDGDASNDLVDLHGSLQDSNRATHLNGKQFDRILFSQSLMEDNRNHRDLVFVRGLFAKDLVVVGEVEQGRFPLGEYVFNSQGGPGYKRSLPSFW